MRDRVAAAVVGRPRVGHRAGAAAAVQGRDRLRGHSSAALASVARRQSRLRWNRLVALDGHVAGKVRRPVRVGRVRQLDRLRAGALLAAGVGGLPSTRDGLHTRAVVAHVAVGHHRRGAVVGGRRSARRCRICAVAALQVQHVRRAADHRRRRVLHRDRLRASERLCGHSGGHGWFIAVIGLGPGHRNRGNVHLSGKCALDDQRACTDLDILIGPIDIAVIDIT